MPDAYVLMYHRICERGPDTACYFARGTAVEPHIFASQLDFLAHRFELLTPSQWLSVRAEPGPPVVVLTLDDAYQDVVEHVVPRTNRFGMYAIAGHTAESDPLCWVDEYYGVLHTARRRATFSIDAIRRAPGLDEDLRWWVRGPFKETLRAADEPKRKRMLNALREALRADAPLPCAEVYCSQDELQSIIHAGGEVGGHGWHHLRLTDVSLEQRGNEIESSWSFLDALGAGRPHTFCYPDGAWDDSTANAIAARGFGAAFTVEPGVATSTRSPWALPRFIVRNRPPTDPSWCAAFAEQHHA